MIEKENMPLRYPSVIDLCKDSEHEVFAPIDSYDDVEWSRYVIHDERNVPNRVATNGCGENL